MIQAYKEMWLRWSDFSGRSTVSDYWWVVLVNFLIQLSLFALMSTPSEALTSLAGVLFGIYVLAAIVPGVAVLVRRLHDTDRSGWWALIIIIPFGAWVLIAFTLLAGSPGSNTYGPPRQGRSATVPPPPVRSEEQALMDKTPVQAAAGAQSSAVSKRSADALDAPLTDGKPAAEVSLKSIPSIVRYCRRCRDQRVQIITGNSDWRVCRQCGEFNWLVDTQYPAPANPKDDDRSRYGGVPVDAPAANPHPRQPSRSSVNPAWIVLGLLGALSAAGIVAAIVIPLFNAGSSTGRNGPGGTEQSSSLVGTCWADSVGEQAVQVPCSGASDWQLTKKVLDPESCPTNYGSDYEYLEFENGDLYCMTPR